jgi:two-component sensor histidine kinase
VNELISNIFKHAFPDGMSGEVLIQLFRTDTGEIEICVSDNGVGVPEGFNFRTQKTLGLQTIFAIAEQQLCGKIFFETQHGVSSRLTFRDKLYAPRIQ